MKNCDTCGVLTRNYALIPDPKEDKFIIRCKHCRQLSRPFKSPSGIQGP